MFSTSHLVFYPLPFVISSPHFICFPPLLIYFPISLSTSLNCCLLPYFCYQLPPSYLLPLSLSTLSSPCLLPPCHCLLSHCYSTPSIALSTSLFLSSSWLLKSFEFVTCFKPSLLEKKKNQKIFRAVKLFCRIP